MSLFANLKVAPVDPIFSVTAAHHADHNPEKINLAIGVYLNDAGRLPLMRAIQLAENARVKQQLAHPYLQIEGLSSYRDAVKKLLFGAEISDSEQQKIVCMQTPGGTGALHIGARFLQQCIPGATVAISDPTWENHRAIFELLAFNVVNYPYYDKATKQINFLAMLDFLKNLPTQSIVILHACCHNPTGMDLNASQWQQVIAACQAQQLIPFLDMAYQGFGTDLLQDANVVHQFARAGMSFIVANSFSKSFSLYGERVGALLIVTQNNDEAHAVFSQVKRLARAVYSNPPSFGALLVSDVLNSPELFELWKSELSEMCTRVYHMRHELVRLLTIECPQIDFNFLKTQKGLFSYSGLTAPQVQRLQKEYSIYALASGRICVAGLTQNNVEKVAKAIASVLN